MKKILLILSLFLITVFGYSQFDATFGNLKADTMKAKDGERLNIGLSGDTTNIDGMLQYEGSSLFKIDTITSGDATPDVSGSNLFTYKGASANVTLTDLDNPKVGFIYTIIGGEYQLTIESGGNFKIDESVVLLNNDVISFLCLTDNYYICTSYKTYNTYDWFVSTTGNDGWAGTSIETAFLTLGAANTAASNGDKILILPGNYDMGILTISKGLEIYGYGATLTDNSGGANWFTFSGVEVKTFNGITFDSDAITMYAFAMATSGNNYFTDCEFTHDGTTNYIFWKGQGSGGTTITDCTILGGDVGISYQPGDQTYYGCTFNDVQGNGIYSATQVADITVENCTIDLLSGSFLDSRINGWKKIKNCTITTSGSCVSLTYQTGVGTAGDMNLEISDCDITISHSISALSFIYSRATYQFDTIYIKDNTITQDVTIAEGIIGVYAGDTCSITGNTITSTYAGATSVAPIAIATEDVIGVYVAENTITNKSEAGYSIKIGGEATSAHDDKITGIVEKNIIYGGYYFDAGASTAVHGLFAGFNKGIDFKYNYVDGCAFGGAYKHDSTDITGVMSYNVFINNEYGIRAKSASRLKAYNNTIVMTATNGLAAISLDIDVAGRYSDSAVIKNNIIYFENTVTANAIAAAANFGIGSIIDYNLVYGVSDAPIYEINGITYDGWTAIQAAGYEANGVNSDPSFEIGYYYLRDGSPAYLAGAAIAGYGTGLSKTSVWPSAVVTVSQPISPTIGAYID